MVIVEYTPKDRLGGVENILTVADTKVQTILEH